MALGPTVKKAIQLAGQKMAPYLDDALGLAGTLGQKAAQSGLEYGKRKFAKDLVGAAATDTPYFLRSSPQSFVPKAGKLLGQAGLFAAGIGAAAIMDQQSEHSQPIPKGFTGNKEMDNFLMQQQLAQQKFDHELALTYAREEARIPGKQLDVDLATYRADADVDAAYYKGRGTGGYGTGQGYQMRSDILRDRAEAERLYTEAGEITNREVLGTGRMIFGTGTRL